MAVLWNPWDALVIVDALLCTLEVLISCARVWPVHWNSLKSPEVFVFVCLFLRVYSNYSISPFSFLPPSPPIYSFLLSFNFMTSCSSIVSVWKHAFAYARVTNYNLLYPIMLFVCMFSEMSICHWTTNWCVLQACEGYRSRSQCCSVASSSLCRVEVVLFLRFTFFWVVVWVRLYGCSFWCY